MDTGTVVLFCVGFLILLVVGGGIIALFFAGTTGYLAFKGAKAVAKGTKVVTSGASEKVKHVSRSVTDEIPGVASIPRETRKWLKEARHYAKLIGEPEKSYTPSQRNQLDKTIQTVNNLLANLDILEEHLRQLYSKRNVRKELQQVTSEVSDLRKQLQSAEGKSRKILSDLVERKEKHLTVLNSINDFQDQIELKIRHNATILNSTHAEIMLLVGRSGLDNNKIRRLNEDLRENSDSLMDLLEVIEEMDEHSY